LKSAYIPLEMKETGIIDNKKMSAKDQLKSGKLKSIFKKAVLGGLAVFLAAVGMEYNGYRFLDTDKGKNLLCAVDPDCRYMTEGEIKMAQDIFGDQIDYRHVKIFDRPWMGIPFEFEFHGLKVAPVAMTPTKARQDSSACPPDIAKTGKEDNKTSFIFINGQLWKIERPLFSRHDLGRSPNGNVYFNPGAYETDYTQASSDKKLSFLHELTHVFQHQSGYNLILRALEDSRRGDYDDSYDYKIDEIKDLKHLTIEQQAKFTADYARSLWQYRENSTYSNRQDLEKYLKILAPYLTAAHEKLSELELHKKLPEFSSAVPLPQQKHDSVMPPVLPPPYVVKPSPLPLEIAPAAKPACPVPGSL
jgi:hypothetical protein